MLATVQLIRQSSSTSESYGDAAEGVELRKKTLVKRERR